MWVYRDDSLLISAMAAADWMRDASTMLSTGDVLWLVGSNGAAQYAVTSTPNSVTLDALGGGGGPAYTLPTAFVIHGFNAATGWFPTNAGPITITAEGDAACVFTDTSTTASGTATNHAVINGDPATWGVVALLTDLGGREAGAGAARDPQLMLSGSSVGVRIGAGGSGGTGGTFDSGAAVGENLASLVENIGEFWSCGNVASMTNLPSAGDIGLRTEPSVAPGGRSIRQKVLLGNAAGRPTFLIRVDDLSSTAVPLLTDLLAAHNFKATWFTPIDHVGDSNRLTLAQLQAIRNAGHAVCLNLTTDDNVITGLADPAAVIAGLTTARSWLASGNFDAEGGNHVVYSNGIFGVNPVPVQKTDITGSSGSAVITMASTATITAGMRVVGVGVPNSPVTTVLTVDSGTQITLSANLTAAHGGSGRMKFVDTSDPFYSRLMQDALAAAGVKTGWTTLGGTFYSRYGVGNRALVLPGNSSTNLAAGTIEGLVDAAILKGSTVQQYFHNFQAGGTSSGLTSGIDIVAAGFAYLKSKVDANLIDVMTVPAWWARDCASPAIPPAA